MFPTSSYYCKVLAYHWVLDPLHFVSYIQWLINPLCLYLSRPYTLWLFKLDLQGNVQCSVTCLRTFLQRISEALWWLYSQQLDYSVWNYYVPHKTAVLLGFFFLPLVKGKQKSDIFHINKIHCLRFMLPEVFQI